MNQTPMSSGGDASRTDTATDRAGEVAETAKDQAAQVAGTVKDQAGAVAQEASRQAQDMVGQVKDTLHCQAVTRTNELAGTLHRWSDEARALADGRTEEADQAGRYARQAGDKLGEFAQRIDQRGFDGLVDDVQRFAREKPGLFLLGAGVAGFVAGRLLRGATGGDEANATNGKTGTRQLSGGQSSTAPVPVTGPAVWSPESEPTLPTASGAPTMPPAG